MQAKNFPQQKSLETEREQAAEHFFVKKKQKTIWILSICNLNIEVLVTYFTCN